MTLTIKLFAKARDLVGTATIQISWSDGESVADLKSRLSELHPALLPLIPRLLVAVNNNYATDSDVIAATDEVACFPPVSGG